MALELIKVKDNAQTVTKREIVKGIMTKYNWDPESNPNTQMD